MDRMGRDKWNEKLEKGFAELTQDNWEDISKELSDGKVQSPVWADDYRKPVLKRIQAVITAAAVLICVFFVIKDANTVKSVLYIDVNPSISISVNYKGRVLSIDGVNEDGSRVVDAAQEKIGNSHDLGTTVSCIIAEIDREGYFRDGTLDALVSLGYKGDYDKSLLDKACAAIEEYAGSNDKKSAVLSQSFVVDEALEKAASDIGISAGKYKFISELAEEGKVDLSKINDLAEESTAELIMSESAKDEPTNTAEENDSPDIDVTAEQNNDETEVNTGEEKAKEKSSSVNKKKTSEKKPKKTKKEKKPKKEKKNKKNNGKSSENKGNKGNKENKGNKNKNKNGNGN